MTVHFIGAGPGAPDLITMRGRDLIARSPVCLYAGSLIPGALLDHCPPHARIVDTAPLDLDATFACVEATASGEDAARLHSGTSRFSKWAAAAAQAAGGPVHGHAGRPLSLPPPQRSNAN
jgi:precorrin-4/cobalt-precorrin-4 C11-methyltransferase